MVTRLAAIVLCAPLASLQLVAGDADGVALIERLEPEQRAKVLMALLGILLVGLLLIAAVILSGRRVRRLARRKATLPTSPPPSLPQTMGPTRADLPAASDE